MDREKFFFYCHFFYLIRREKKYTDIHNKKIIIRFLLYVIYDFHLYADTYLNM